MLSEPRALVVLTALAQETRLRIVRAVVAAYPMGLPAGEVARRVGCAPSTLTFHLHHLEQAGVLRSRRQSTSIIYSAQPDVLRDLADYLMRDCCGGRPELCRPADPPWAAEPRQDACAPICLGAGTEAESG